MTKSSERRDSTVVEVVVCTKDRPAELRRCLDALFAQSRPADRIRVIDGGRSKAVRSTRVEVIASEPGLTRQRNLALETSEADLIVFVDDDAELEPGYLEAMLRWFREQPDCVAAAGNITNDGRHGRLSRLFRRLFALADADGKIRRSGEGNYLRHPTVPTRVDVVSGSNLALRRTAVGGLRFDEDFAGYGYMEDVEFCLQVASQGELWTIPDARLVHEEAPTARVTDREYVRQVLVNGARVYAKHGARFGFRPLAFARRVVGRSIAYLGAAVRRRSLEPVRGIVDGLGGIATVLGGPLRPLSGPANLALIGVVLTPLALVFDYRIGSGVIEGMLTYVPYAENNGFPATYKQVFGTSQILWLALGGIALSRESLRGGFRSLTVICLGALLALVVAVTAALDGIDGYATLALASTLLTMIAMAAVLVNPWIGQLGVRRLVLAFALGVAVVTGGTLGLNTLHGDLGERFDLVLFGPPTDTGLALATTLVLLPAVRAPVSVIAVIGLPLLAGLVLTGTRGALVALAGGAWALALLVPHRRAVAVATVTGLVAVVLAAFILLSQRSLLLTDDASDLRQAELERHWQLFLARPTYGYGLAEQAAHFSTGAHNAVLGIANAAGVGAALLWIVAWTGPVAWSIRRRSFEWAVGAAVLTSAVLGWFTTGTELLLYTPPTNLLPLLLGLALAVTATSRRAS